jgi:hypothetical protein
MTDFSEILPKAGRTMNLHEVWRRKLKEVFPREEILQ